MRRCQEMFGFDKIDYACLFLYYLMAIGYIAHRYYYDPQKLVGIAFNCLYGGHTFLVRI